MDLVVCSALGVAVLYRLVDAQGACTGLTSPVILSVLGFLCTPCLMRHEMLCTQPLPGCLWRGGARAREDLAGAQGMTA